MSYQEILVEYRRIASAIGSRFLSIHVTMADLKTDLMIRGVYFSIKQAASLIETWLAINPSEDPLDNQTDHQNRRNQRRRFSEFDVFQSAICMADSGNEVDPYKVVCLISAAERHISEVSEKIAEDVCLSMNSLWKEVNSPTEFIKVLNRGGANTDDMLERYPFLEHVNSDSVLQSVAQTIQEKIFQENNIVFHQAINGRVACVADRSPDEIAGFINFVANSQRLFWDFTTLDFSRVSINVWFELAEIFQKQKVVEIILNRNTLTYFIEHHPTLFASACIISGILSVNILEDLNEQDPLYLYLKELKQILPVFHEFFSQDALQNYTLAQLKILSQYLHEQSMKVCDSEEQEKIEDKKNQLNLCVSQSDDSSFDITRLQSITFVSGVVIMRFIKEIESCIEATMFKEAASYLDNLFVNYCDHSLAFKNAVLKAICRAPLSEEEILSSKIARQFIHICNLMNSKALHNIHQYFRKQALQFDREDSSDTWFQSLMKAEVLIEEIEDCYNYIELTLFEDDEDLNVLMFVMAHYYFHNGFIKFQDCLTTIGNAMECFEILSRFQQALAFQNCRLHIDLDPDSPISSELAILLPKLPVTDVSFEPLLPRFPEWMMNNFNGLFPNANHVEFQISEMLVEQSGEMGTREESVYLEIFGESAISFLSKIPGRVNRFIFSNYNAYNGEITINADQSARINSILKNSAITEIVVEGYLWPFNVSLFKNLSLCAFTIKIHDYDNDRTNSWKSLREHALILMGLENLDRLTIDIQALYDDFNRLQRLKKKTDITEIEQEVINLIESTLREMENIFVDMLENARLQKCHFLINDPKLFLILLKNILPRLTKGRVFIGYEFEKLKYSDVNVKLLIQDLLLPYQHAWKVKSGQGGLQQLAIHGFFKHPRAGETPFFEVEGNNVKVRKEKEGVKVGYF